MKNFILIMFCVFVSFIFPESNGQAGIQQQEPTEEQIAVYKRKIEDYCDNRLTELRLRMQTQIRLLEIAEAPKPDLITLAEWTRFVEAVLKINCCNDDSTEAFDIAEKTIAERLADALGRIATRKSDISNKFEWEAIRLYKQKEYALTKGLKEYENKLHEGESASGPEKTFGVVTGILYAKGSSTALVDGEILREGQIIHDVKLLRIYKNKVEFEANGTKWTQKVRQQPQEYWR